MILKKLDIYIIRGLFINIVFAFTLLVLIVITLNIAERIDMLIASQLSVWGWFVEYYVKGFIPSIMILLFPVLVFITVTILTSRMATHSEIIAIRASGISYIRFLMPFIIWSMTIFLVHWGLINFILPASNKARITFEEKHRPQRKTGENQNQDYFNALYLRSDKHTFVTLKNYSTYSKRAGYFFVDSIVKHRLVKRYFGRDLEWIDTLQVWRGNLVTMQTDFDKNKLTERKKNTIFFVFSFDPNDANLDNTLKDKLGREDLKAYIDRERVRGTDVRPLQLELYKRDASPFLIIILSLIAAMLSSKKIRGGRGMHITVAALIMGFYTLLDRSSSIFAVKANFPPVLAAWTPHIIFGIVCMIIYRQNCKSAV